MRATSRPGGCGTPTETRPRTPVRNAPRTSRRSLSPEHALALAARADERHRDAHLPPDQLDVLARRRGQRGQILGLVEGLEPPGQHLVDRLGMVEVALVRR